MPTTIKEALKKWQDAHPDAKIEEAKELPLYYQLPPIEKMDSSLGVLTACEKLSLSTNSIDRITGLNGLNYLKILSLGRNVIKTFGNGLDPVANTLEQLWISYNLIDKLTGISVCKRLKVLYMSNNKLDKWSELERLQDLPDLEDLLLIGNPIQQKMTEEGNWRIKIVALLPKLKKLDGQPIDDTEREAAAAL